MYSYMSCQQTPQFFVTEWAWPVPSSMCTQYPAQLYMVMAIAVCMFILFYFLFIFCLFELCITTSQVESKGDWSAGGYCIQVKIAYRV